MPINTKGGLIREGKVDIWHRIVRSKNHDIFSTRQCYRAKSHYIAIINNNFNMSNEFLYLPVGHIPDRF